MISIHPTALVASKTIGDGTRIWAFVNILAGARIGRDCNICDRCFIENDVTIGDRVTVKCGVSLYDALSLEDDVFVGPGVIFSNDPRPRSGQWLEAYPRTIVRTGASLGSGAILLPGITVGRFALVGAGSLVSREVPDFALVYGNPARVHGHVCRCGRTLRFDGGSAVCACGQSFVYDTAGQVRESA